MPQYQEEVSQVVELKTVIVVHSGCVFAILPYIIAYSVSHRLTFRNRSSNILSNFQRRRPLQESGFRQSHCLLHCGSLCVVWSGNQCL